MLVFLNAYGLVITIASGILGFIAFFESRRHPVFRRPGSVTGIVALVVCLMVLPASLVTQLQSSSESVRLGTTPTSASSNPESETTIVPTQAQATPTPSPTLPSNPAIPRLKSSYNGTGTGIYGENEPSLVSAWYLNSQDQKGNFNFTVIFPHLSPFGATYKASCNGTITNLGRISIPPCQPDIFQFDGLRYSDGHMEGTGIIGGVSFQYTVR